MNEDSRISLTEKGKEIAVHIYERHKLLTNYLVAFGVPIDIARADACKIEHDLSEETFEAIRRQYKKL